MNHICKNTQTLLCGNIPDTFMDMKVNFFQNIFYCLIFLYLEKYRLNPFRILFGKERNSF